VIALLSVCPYIYVHSAHSDLNNVTFRLFLSRNCGVTNEAPLSEADLSTSVLKKRTRLGENKSSFEKSRRGLNPRMTVLARTRIMTSPIVAGQPSVKRYHGKQDMSDTSSFKRPVSYQRKISH
jgi:hypothetical protein